MRHRILLSLTPLLAAGLMLGCVVVRATDTGEPDHDHDAEHATAFARIEAKSGSSVSGHARFTQRHEGVLVEIHVENAPPGWHAVHIHEIGDCSAEDGTSAGGHFNPGGHDHGSPHAAVHHAGDLGNMLVGDDGVGHHAIFMPELTVDAGDHSVVGRGIIVHADADDLVSQPTGAAGGRIGCGVIR